MRIDPWETHLVFTRGVDDRLYLSDLGLAKGHANHINNQGADVKVVLAGFPPYEWDRERMIEAELKKTKPSFFEARFMVRSTRCSKQSGRPFRLLAEAKT